MKPASEHSIGKMSWEVTREWYAKRNTLACSRVLSRLASSAIHHFSWIFQSSQEKSKTVVMQSYGGGDKQGALWYMWKWWILHQDKNEKSEDYSKADLKQRVLFFITIFRLAKPAFFRFTDVTELTYQSQYYIDGECRNKRERRKWRTT